MFVHQITSLLNGQHQISSKIILVSLLTANNSVSLKEKIEYITNDLAFKDIILEEIEWSKVLLNTYKNYKVNIIKNLSNANKENAKIKTLDNFHNKLLEFKETIKPLEKWGKFEFKNFMLEDNFIPNLQYFAFKKLLEHEYLISSSNEKYINDEGEFNIRFSKTNVIQFNMLNYSLNSIVDKHTEEVEAMGNTSTTINEMSYC